ncbi:MAG TPA: HAD family hydrolase [Thermoanaerobaculia bacterium]|nr:HAD family hydrolase [Thermoanaerobaculia bacterium]
MRRRLVLFDIDGTLVNDGGASRDAFALALATVYGYRGDVGRYDFSGRTDPYIAYMVLRDDGFSDEEIAKKLPALWHAYIAGLQRNATPDRVRSLPGMAPLLESLRTMDNITLALLTGNIEPGARLKLGPPALNDYFSFGAFGSDSADRSELPPIAVERASQRDGYRFEGPDVVIIGDSIYDVRCGAPYNATTIAVASGKTSADLLRAENPRHFFESAEDLPGMLAAICEG